VAAGLVLAAILIAAAAISAVLAPR
jgi:hypothetical protein